jgi:tRNA (guanine26-N2/guanine27-N2)-dimethyltransferase
LLNLNKGYRVSISHTDALAIKTDAPLSVLWDILRCWNKLYPVKRIPEGSPAAVILGKVKQINTTINRIEINKQKTNKNTNKNKNKNKNKK